MKKTYITCAFACAAIMVLLSFRAVAQTVAPAYSSVYSVHVIGSIAGLPTNYGGMTFKVGDPNTILIGGAANGASGRFYEVPVVRGPGNHITGFGTPVAMGFGGNNDGGVTYGPGNVLLYSKYNINQIGQVKVGSNSDDKVVQLAPLNVAASPGALNFVPVGMAGAGRLKVMSYSSGRFYDVAYSADGSGTFNLTSATQTATLPGGPEGMIYVGAGSPLFPSDVLLVTAYDSGKVVAYDINASGNPVVSSGRDFITGLTGGEGAAIDPVTGDFMFSTFGASNRVVRIEGFVPPPPAATIAAAGTFTTVGVAGQPVTFTVVVSGVPAFSGTVSFVDGISSIPGCASVAITTTSATSGTASCTTSSLSVGPHSVTATYSGNSANGGSSTIFSVTITPANQAPVASSLSGQTPVNTPLDGHLAAGDADGNPLVFSIVTPPAHGAATLTDPATGALTYTPNPGFIGQDSLTFRANDGTVDSNMATLSITVYPVPTQPNQPPLAGSDFYTTPKNVALRVAAPGVLSNDFDPDGTAVNLVTLPGSGPAHGTVVSTGGGGFVYTPANNFVGPDSFQYTISDGLATVTGTVSLIVTDTNTAPVAHDDSYSTAGNVKLTVPGPGLLANDSDPDITQPLRAVVMTQPAKGMLVMTSGGGFEFTPNPAVCSSDSIDTFTYRAFDGLLYSSLATVTIGIHCTNRAPVANADSYTVAQGGRLNIPPKGVLVNDTDADGNTLSLVLVSNTTQGPLAANPDGSFTYIAPYAAGTDTFTYKATDGGLESQPVAVTITVTATNRPPLAGNDSYSTAKNGLLNVPAPGVLSNDLDLDGNPLTLTVMSQPSHGSLHMNPDGSFTYTPANNYVGLDSFDYVAYDGAATSPAATVIIDVRDANFPPVARDDSYTVAAGTTLQVAAPGLLANDNDPDGNQPLQVILATQPTKGTLTLTVGGGFEYTPNLPAICSADDSDSFTYYANDSVVNSILATVTITIHCTNQPPVAQADSYAVAQDGWLTVTAKKGILSNDTDPDGNTLYVVLLSAPAQGALAMHPDGSFNFLPPGTFSGTVSFTYKATDGLLESAASTVTINVTATNSAPLGGGDRYQVAANATLDIAAPGVLSNDFDIENNQLSAILVNAPSHGSVHLDLDGSFTYRSFADYFGLDYFTYLVNDGLVNSDLVTVVIQVGPGHTVFLPLVFQEAGRGHTAYLPLVLQ